MKLEKVYLTKENLLKIEKLDDLYYTDAITGIDWYLQRYNEHHNAYFLINDKSNVVGYILSVPIKKELYDAITSGVIVNDLYVNPKMYIDESTYHYIYSCVITKEYRHQKYGTMLMEKLLDDLKGNICCLTISKDGYKLANKYMDLKEIINESVSVFIKNNN